jgi:hypothetical protein
MDGKNTKFLFYETVTIENNNNNPITDLPKCIENIYIDALYIDGNDYELNLNLPKKLKNFVVNKLVAFNSNGMPTAWGKNNAENDGIYFLKYFLNTPTKCKIKFGDISTITINKKYLDKKHFEVIVLCKADSKYYDESERYNKYLSKNKYGTIKIGNRNILQLSNEAQFKYF